MPGDGWAHFVHRQDKGDLLGCANNGALYSIDYSQTTSTGDGTATLLTSPAGVTSCKGLAWDAEADVIYVGIASPSTGDDEQVVRFNDGATTSLGTFVAPCATNGLAISGGVLLMSCESDETIRRLDKTTGVSLGAHGSLTATGLARPRTAMPGLGGFACDPVTFHKDATGKDLFTDVLWSRRGATAMGWSPSSSRPTPAACPRARSSFRAGCHFPRWPRGSGLPLGQPGAIPRAACFDISGQVIDADRDGIPDCWEASGGGIDFDGDATIDVGLCVPVDTNGDGVTDARSAPTRPARTSSSRSTTCRITSPTPRP